jgi:GxxExxY protein
MELVYKDEAYSIIGVCMEVHRFLGRGFSEIVYKDAIEYELRAKNMNFSREQEFRIIYKDIILPHNYYADFIIENKIVLEVKAIEMLTSSHIKQVLNYLAASKLKLGLLVNFGEDSLAHKRIIL